MKGDMSSIQDTRREIKLALLGVAIIIPFGVIGFMLLERDQDLSLLDAFWITVTTLTTIGYGDITAVSEAGRVFTLILILVGLGVILFGIQATASFFLSPGIRDLRQKRRIESLIGKLEHHFILCGAGDLVDNTITYLVKRADVRQASQIERLYEPVDNFLDRIFGDDAEGHYPRVRGWFRNFYFALVGLFSTSESLLDILVVITEDAEYADRLRNNGLLVIEGASTDDDVLIRAGIQKASSLIIMLDSDTEALLTVLTARTRNPDLYITAATLQEDLIDKMIRIGADNAITPFNVAGAFFNGATLRPAVNSYFNTILFNEDAEIEAIQIDLYEDSPWVGKCLRDVNLRDRFSAGILGLRLADGSYLYAPNDDIMLEAEQTIVSVVPALEIAAIQRAAVENTSHNGRVSHWQHVGDQTKPQSLPSGKPYSLVEAEEAASEMSDHFVICGTGRVAKSAVRYLDPTRPFAVISDDNEYTLELLERGFRVVHGNPTHEETLRKAGVDRALAIMVSIDDKADSVLTVLTCRQLSERLLITTSADAEDMIEKLQRAGADRVASAFRIAAQVVMLATTRPAVSDFLQYVLFNRQASLETTELYMQDNSPWIGQTIKDLRLEDDYQTGVIGVRLADGNFVYAPPTSHVMGEFEVLIAVTPMEHSDTLRLEAQGGPTSRPYTLRDVTLATRPQLDGGG